MTQAYISKFEHRGDVLMSTLFAYVQALGGELEIRAKLPGRGDVKITQFDHLREIAEEGRR